MEFQDVEDEFNTSGRRTGYPVLLTSRNSHSVILTINLSRHNDSDGLGCALCQLKLVLSKSESELQDVNITGYRGHRPVSVKVIYCPFQFFSGTPLVGKVSS